MSAYRLAGIPSNRLLVPVALAAGIVLFAGGALTGRAMAGDNAGRAVTRINLVQPSGGAGSPAAATDRDDGLLAAEEAKRALSSYSAPSDMRYWAYCPGTLPTGSVNSTIDPVAAGVAMRLLGGGFELQSITLRSEGDCDDQGNPVNVQPVLETNWLHTETGATVWVHQRASDETANYIDSYSALVWSDGYRFQLSVSGGWAMPLAEDAARASEGGATDSSLGTASIAAPPSLTEEQMQAALEAAVAQLAPDVAAECFYRMVPGGWDSLVALGLGDPRGAIPPEFTEEYVNVRVLRAPADGCGTPELEGYYGASFDASFSDGVGGWMGVSAYEVLAGETPYPGWLGSGSLSWSDGEWQYNVYGYGPSGMPVDEGDLTAIASLLAPSFDGSCLAQDRALSPGELVAAGFHAPEPPDGFTVVKSELLFNGVPEGCDAGDSGQASSYRSMWSLADGAGTHIEVNVSRYEASSDDRAAGGYISDFGAGWTDAAGTSFNIYISSGSGQATLDRDAIIALAQSLDPAMDPATLAEDGGGEPLPAKPATR